MASGSGFKATYDYVELTVEPCGTRWRLTLIDRRHAEKVVHDEEYATAEEAMEGALPVAQHHINVQHNDTLSSSEAISWKAY